MGRRRKRVEGECRVCGRHGRLSYEHVPPEAAYNDHAVVQVQGRRALAEYRREKPTGPTLQRGAGEHTLCERCNSRTGGWYGAALVSWCRQGAAVLQATEGNPTLLYPYYLYPLRALKEIATMFFSVNEVGFRNGPTKEIRHAGGELAQMILSRDRRLIGLPFRFFVYFTTSTTMRRFVGWGLMHRGEDTYLLSEISFPPFGYLITYAGEPPHRDLQEITAFGDYGYDDFRMMHLKLRLLPIASPYPGDYRTAAEVAAVEDGVYELADADGGPSSLVAVHVPSRGRGVAPR